MKTLKAFALLLSIFLFTNNKSIHANKIEFTEENVLLETITEIEKTFNEENPWCFIQKKLFEEPNNKLYSPKNIMFDLLLLSWAPLLRLLIYKADSLFFSSKNSFKEITLINNKISFFLNFCVFLYSNISRQKSYKNKALESFLKGYQNEDYKKYTPETLWPIFDNLSNLSEDDLDEFLSSSEYRKLLENIEEMIKKDNPSFKNRNVIAEKSEFVIQAVLTYYFIKACTKWFSPEQSS